MSHSDRSKLVLYYGKLNILAVLDLVRQKENLKMSLAACSWSASFGLVYLLSCKVRFFFFVLKNSTTLSKGHNVSIFLLWITNGRCNSHTRGAQWENSRTQWKRLGCIPLRLLRSIFLIGPQRTQNHSAVYNTFSPDQVHYHETKTKGVYKYIPIICVLQECFQSAGGCFCVFRWAEKQTWEIAGKRERKTKKRNDFRERVWGRNGPEAN